MPDIGRFGQVDPVTDGQEQYSTYQYGWGNPVLRSDPNGDCPKCKEFIGGFATGVSNTIKSAVNEIAHPIDGVMNLIQNLQNDPIGISSMTLGTQAGVKLATNDARGAGEITGEIVANTGIIAAVGKGMSGKNISPQASAETQTLYRGVNSTSPAFSQAQSGVVKPRGGLLGHSNVAKHNSGLNGTVNSKFTSWTTNQKVATNYALRTSGNGVVLSQQVPKSSIISSPNTKTVQLIQGGGRVSETEVLLKGTQNNLNVKKIGQ
jgi:hypothetical protein